MSLRFKYKNVVVGNNMKAVFFAFKEGFPIIFKELEKPFEREHLETGENKKQLMEFYLQLLSLGGLVPFALPISDIEIHDKKLIVTGKRPWKIEIEVEEKIYNFLDEHYRKNKFFKVVDHINVRSCSPHYFKEIKDDKDKFVNIIKFHPSQRDLEAKRYGLNPNPNKDYADVIKDIEAISFLTQKQIDSDEFSPVYSRIKVKQMMKDNGLKGKKSGFEYRPHKGKVGTQLYKPLSLEFAKREIFKIDEDEKYDMVSKNAYIKRLVYFIWVRAKRSKQVVKAGLTFT